MVAAGVDGGALSALAVVRFVVGEQSLHHVVGQDEAGIRVVGTD